MYPFHWPFIVSFPIVFLCYFRLEISGTQTLVSVCVVKVSIFLYNIFLLHNKEIWVVTEHKHSYFWKGLSSSWSWPMSNSTAHVPKNIGKLGHRVKIRFFRAPCLPTPLAKLVHSSLCKLSGRMADFTERNAHGSAKICAYQIFKLWEFFSILLEYSSFIHFIRKS